MYGRTSKQIAYGDGAMLPENASNKIYDIQLFLQSFIRVSHESFLPPHQVSPWSHGKCGGILAAVGDVKAPSPWLPSSGLYRMVDGALFVIVLFSAVSFILVPHLLAFCLSIPLFFSYLFIFHALLNKNYAFLFNTMRLLNISANFAVDYQHH